MFAPCADPKNLLDHTESLTLSICRVLKRAGGRADYLDVNAALGISWLFAACPAAESVASWTYLVRDWRIDNAAELFGIRLRELHRPDAMIGLESSREYRQHFLDSYRPLIAGAVRNGQPVLACRGWSGERAPCWGVITEACDGWMGLAGFVGDADTTVVLTGPAVQCYVIERVEPVTSDSATLLEHGLAAARDALGGAIDLPGESVVGDRAYALWRERLQAESVDASVTGRIAAAHAQVAASLAANRQSGAEFVARHRASLPENLAASVDELIEGTREAADAMASIANVSDVVVTLKSGGGLEKLESALRRAADADRACGELAAAILADLRG